MAEGGQRRGFAGDWFKCPRRTVHRILPRYGPQVTCLLMILFEARDMQTLLVKGVSQEEIGRLLGHLSPRQVRRLSKPLRDDGLIEGIQRGPHSMWYRLSPDFANVLERVGEEKEPPAEDTRRVGGPLYDKTAEFPERTKDRTKMSGLPESPDKNVPSRKARPDTRPDTRPDIYDRSLDPYKESGTETRDKRIKSSSSFSESSISQQNQNISSSQHLDRKQILAYLCGWIPGLNPSQEGVVDNDALEKLITGCLAEDPEASTEEITYFIAQKGMALYRKVPTDMGHKLEPRPDVHSPMGFLRQAVVQCFAGEHSAARQYRARRKEKAANG